MSNADATTEKCTFESPRCDTFQRPSHSIRSPCLIHGCPPWHFRPLTLVIMSRIDRLPSHRVHLISRPSKPDPPLGRDLKTRLPGSLFVHPFPATWTSQFQSTSSRCPRSQTRTQRIGTNGRGLSFEQWEQAGIRSPRSSPSSPHDHRCIRRQD